MKAWKSLLIAALLVLMPALAQAAPPPDGSYLAKGKTPAVFCQGKYALCIKAKCLTIPTGQAAFWGACSCDVVDGISMGPASCEARKPYVKDGVTVLMSTYSNDYNTKHKTMTCDNDETKWAWCYGAPCAVNPDNPSEAICNCPLRRSTMSTLGGECGKAGGGCDGLWSAARPRADKAANVYFYEYVSKHYPGYPVNKPAEYCSAK